MRDHFIAAMQAEPDNDSLRLVFADWLEDQGDPLAEFIRLQMELEPLRVPCAELMAELERHKRLHRIPPGKARWDDDWRFARQLKREQDLLRLHRKDWLGEIAVVENQHETYFEPEFRRGFVASAQIGLTALMAHGAHLCRCCPILQRLIVCGTLGRGKDLASVTAVAGIPQLTVAGWLNEPDAGALQRSPHFAGVQSLTFWLGADQDAEAASRIAELPGLKELTLVQLWGGIAADNAEELDQRADAIVDQVKRARPELAVHLQRPFTRRFPLDGVHIERGLYAGTMPENQAVLVSVRRDFELFFFDSEGRFQRVEHVEIPEEDLPKGWDWDWAEQPLMGFRPGPIFVREFTGTEICIRCWAALHHESLLAPYSIQDSEMEWTPEYVGSDLYRWYSTSQFCLPYRLESFVYHGDYWADGLGRVHSS